MGMTFDAEKEAARTQRAAAQLQAAIDRGRKDRIAEKIFARVVASHIAAMGIAASMCIEDFSGGQLSNLVRNAASGSIIAAGIYFEVRDGVDDLSRAGVEGALAGENLRDAMKGKEKGAEE